MDAAGRCIDLLLQRVGIGRFELGELAPFQNLARDRHAVAFEPLQLILVGRPVARLALAPPFQPQLVEQDFAELFGAADREGLAREGVDFALDAQHFGREFARQLCQIVAVDHDPRALHALDDGRERPIDHLINARPALDRQAQLEQFPKPQRDIGVLGGIFGRAIKLDLGKADLRFARAAYVFERQADVIEVKLRQLVEPVLMLACVEREAHHQRVVIRDDGQPVLRQHTDIIFQIMPDLQYRIVGEQRAEAVERRIHCDLFGLFGEHVGAAMAERDITSAARRGRQADPDQPSGDAVEAGGFGVDRDDVRGAGFGDPAVEGVDRRDAFIGRSIDRGHRRQGRRRWPGGRRGGRCVRAGQGRRSAGGGAQIELCRKRAEAMLVQESLERQRRDRAEFQVVERIGQRAIAL